MPFGKVRSPVLHVPVVLVLQTLQGLWCYVLLLACGFAGDLHVDMDMQMEMEIAVEEEKTPRLKWPENSDASTTELE